MTARTISEKILSAKAGHEVHAGEIAICTVDHVLGTDASSPMAIDYFEKMGGERLFDPSRVLFAFDHYAHELAGRLDGAGGGAGRFDVPEGPIVVGTGDPAVSVTASPFELLRALAGRRSEAQIRAYGWDGDADRVVAVLAAYPMRDTPLDE